VRLIDTAGMRKKAKVSDKLEKLAVADARHAVDFAEVVVLLLDATLVWSTRTSRSPRWYSRRPRADHRDQQVGRGGNPSSLFNGIRAALDEGLAQVKGVPLIAVSARTGKGLDELIAAGFASARPGRSACRPACSTAGSTMPCPPIRRQRPAAKRIKLRYITQAKTARRASSCSAPG